MATTLKEGLLVTVFSMAIVFTVLIVISLIIYIQSYLISHIGAPKKKEKQVVKDVEIIPEQEDNLEIIAAITAALTMYTNLSSKQFIIKSIVRTKDSCNWKRA